MTLTRKTFLTDLIGAPIYDKTGNKVGRIVDFTLALNNEQPCLDQAIIYDFESGSEKVAKSYNFEQFSLKKFVLKIGLDQLAIYGKQTERPEATELWDKAVIDTANIRTVEINDLVLEETNGVIRVSGVDIGMRSALMRLGNTVIFGSVLKKIGRFFEADQVDWEKIVGCDEEFETITSKLSNENFQNLHPADLADILRDLDDDDRISFIENLDEELAADTIAEVDTETQLNIIGKLDAKTASDIIEEMDPDEATDLLQEIDKDKADEILKHMDLNEASDVKKLLAHDEYTAGGIMTTEYIAIFEDFTIENTISHLRLVAADIENIYYMYVIDTEERLKGVISIRDIFSSNVKQKVSEVMDDDVVSVHANMPQEEVAAVVAKYDYMSVPVVNDDNQIIGVITVDDVMDVLEEEATEDIFKLAGTSDEELDDDSPWQACKSRLPWLLITLCTGFITSTILKYFMAKFDGMIALVFFVPVVTAMGGNTGVQSSTLAIRGLAVNPYARDNLLKRLLKEIIAGAVMGGVCGFVVGAWAEYLIRSGSTPAAAQISSLYLSMTVGIAMMAAMTFAAAFGAVIPLLFDKFKIDPAVASGPFVTSFNDIFALIIYYAVSTAFLAAYV